MSALVLGPVLRHVDETTATVWVELAERGTVTLVVHPEDGPPVRRDTHTFTVHGHHYAVLEVDGLAPGSTSTYDVIVGGGSVWPPARSPYPPSRIRTLDPAAPLRLLFGSCRTSVPHDAQGNRVHGIDVLRAYALQMTRTDPRQWPTLVLFLGDQVYADEASERMREFIAARRDVTEPPYDELRDYEEYAHLYRLSWADPANRWLLSTLPSAMIFDDHDIRDDWNTSAAWRDAMNRTGWWHDRIVGGLASYWVYQHLGNLSPVERRASGLVAEVLRVGRDGDAGAVLDAFAERTDREPERGHWSYARDLGASRLVVLDTRCGRVLDERDRQMLDDREMRWFEDQATGDVDHLVIASTLPFLLPMGLHHLEAWDEAVTGGAWGRLAARLGERLRQGVDLEHWAAFQQSFQRVARTVLSVARGERGRPPATVLFLSGDVHHSYLAEVRRDGRGSTPVGESRLLQAVCSPIRNPLPRWIRFASATSAYGLAWPMGLLVARSARVPDPPFRWSLTNGPWFDNAIATLDLDGRRARLRWDTAEAADRLTPLQSATLS
ncbi:MAG: alkaline phosphatase family protein [Actinomycetota bacterium]|nr:alkaline phosphatase family protein [Actinomycetota bacterium]